MKANKSSLSKTSKISLYSECMVVYNGFDNRFYLHASESKQDPLGKLNFEV